MAGLGMDVDDSVPLSSSSENPPSTLALASDSLSASSTSFSSSSPSSSSSPPSLDQVEQLLLALLTSSSSLLSQLSTVHPSSPPLAIPHAQTFLTSLSQLRAGLLHCISHGTSERTYRRSAYGEQLLLDVEAEASERISERLEEMEEWAKRWQERQRSSDSQSPAHAEDLPSSDLRMGGAG